MANPTAQDVIDRVRQVLNESEAGLYTDTPANLLQALNGGGLHFHRDVLAAVRQQGPLDPGHPYVRHFIRTGTDTLSTNDATIAVPDDLEEILTVLIGPQGDGTITGSGGLSGERIMRPAQRVANADEGLMHVSRIHGPRQGLAAWHPINDSGTLEIQLYVYPGNNGIPTQSLPYRLIYVKLPDRAATISDTLSWPWDYMDPLVWYACAHAVPRERKMYDAYLGLGQAQVPGIAGIYPQQGQQQ